MKWIARTVYVQRNRGGYTFTRRFLPFSTRNAIRTEKNMIHGYYVWWTFPSIRSVCHVENGNLPAARVNSLDASTIVATPFWQLAQNLDIRVVGAYRRLNIYEASNRNRIAKSTDFAYIKRTTETIGSLPAAVRKMKRRINAWAEPLRVQEAMAVGGSTAVTTSVDWPSSVFRPKVQRTN